VTQERDERSAYASDDRHTRSEASSKDLQHAGTKARSLPNIGQDVSDENRALVLYSPFGGTTLGHAHGSTTDQLRNVSFWSVSLMSFSDSPVRPEAPLLLPSPTTSEHRHSEPT
jgi:hypothetical protein